jgi:hypothetical protein
MLLLLNFLFHRPKRTIQTYRTRMADNHAMSSYFRWLQWNILHSYPFIIIII